MLEAGFKRVDVIPNRTEFREAPSIPDLPVASDWIFVGRVVENKCQHEIVRAFAKYATLYRPAARLWLVGDLSHENYVGVVRAEIARCRVGDRVVLTGKLTTDELDALYTQAGLFVSLSEHEGFGVPLLEAMAADVPVLAVLGRRSSRDAGRRRAAVVDEGPDGRGGHRGNCSGR